MGETNMTDVSEGRRNLTSWLNKNMKIKLTDGRVLIGIFLCTDKDANVILGTCAEYLLEDKSCEPRMLGLAMVPGRHIVTIHVDETDTFTAPVPKNSPSFT